MNCDSLTVAIRLDGVWAAAWGALPVFVASLVATLAVVPIARSVAHATGVVDQPDAVRKLHGRTVAYLGGVGVFVGVFVGIVVGAIMSGAALDALPPVPFSIVLGMVAITFTGLADDIWKFDARLKVAGQLVAAAAMAIDDIGVDVATGLLVPVLGAPRETLFTVGSLAVQNAQLYYWVGTTLVALFVLGGCNAANLLDGLDGLLAGISAVMALGLLGLSLLVIFALPPDAADVGAITQSMAGARVTLCASLLGACLGFLAYNFNPASIFLGDAGSLLIGYLSVTIVMTFANLRPFSCPYAVHVGGDSAAPVPNLSADGGFEGFATLLVMCGLAMFGLPIIDTSLSIIRRWRAKVPFSTPDTNHLHHRVKRFMGGSVRKAVLSLYGFELGLVAIGGAAATYILVGGGRLLYPFIFLVAAFVVLLGISMRGSGVAPTHKAAP
jgi:UDP-GlcNAc:undecaprenyl-phosphate GlcNAc-1-phosphate transferase